MKLLITGGYGFLGTNLASEALKLGLDLTILDNLSGKGAYLNKKWLEQRGKHDFVCADVRDSTSVENLIGRICPDAIFHLAGQVAMTTSLLDPYADFDVNVRGTLNVLEACKKRVPNCILVYSSSNKVYGDLEKFTYLEQLTRWECVERPNGFDEDTPLSFHSPYGCSKGAADQYVLDYARMFGLRTVVLRHSSMYGGRQFATTDQGWVGWFCSEALRVSRGDSSPIRVAGDGKQVRDVLHADDMTRLYFGLLDYSQSISGQAFNIGGGVQNSLSLLELMCMLEKIVDVELKIENRPQRISDQRVFVANIGSIRKFTGWVPSVSALRGIEQMVDWTRDQYN